MRATDQPVFGPWSTLSCPGCGEEFTHQGRVEVFFDNDGMGEDWSTAHVTVSQRYPVIDSDMGGNPSPRRDGVLIHFTCELCDARPVLAIFQHEGSTYLAWRDTTAAVDLCMYE